MMKLAIIGGSFCLCLCSAYSMTDVIPSPHELSVFCERDSRAGSFEVRQAERVPRHEVSMTAEKYLEQCKERLNSGDYRGAVSSFKEALKTEGDQACFFFEDIVRLLVEKGDVNFKIDELYTDYGVTDKAKRELLDLNDQSLISAFRTYLERDSSSTVK